MAAMPSSRYLRPSRKGNRFSVILLILVVAFSVLDVTLLPGYGDTTCTTTETFQTSAHVTSYVTTYTSTITRTITSTTYSILTFTLTSNSATVTGTTKIPEYVVVMTNETVLVIREETIVSRITDRIIDLFIGVASGLICGLILSPWFGRAWKRKKQEKEDKEALERIEVDYGP